MAARRLALVNFKGGVGKTSLAVNLASCLAYNLNQRVLLVDLDAQSNTSIWLMGVPRWNILNGSPEKSVWGIFQPDFAGLKQVLVEEVLLDSNNIELIPNLDLLPATYRLMDLEHEYHDHDRTPYFVRFRFQLEILFDQYDYIIFDCPPNVFRATKCALFSAEEVYVPANPDLLSYVGLSLLAEKISKFQAETTLQRQHFRGYKAAQIRGIVLNSVDRNADYRQVLDWMRAKIVNLRSKSVVSTDADILPTRIRHTVTATRPQADALPATLDRQASTGVREDYLNLARYIHNSPPTTRKGASSGLEKTR